MDGSALLLLTVPMAQSYLGAKLGPAMKLCAHVDQLKQLYASLFAPCLPYAEEPFASLSELLPPVEPISLPSSLPDGISSGVSDHPMADEPPPFVPPSIPVDGGHVDGPIAEGTSDAAAPLASLDKCLEEPGPPPPVGTR